MLQISHVTKYYIKSKPVISDLSLSFGDTGLNTIIGKSGCGKTTLLNLIGTMDRDFIGSITFNDVELQNLSYNQISDYRNYDTAYIFQLNSLFEELTVKQNIEIALDLQNKKSDIKSILERVGLSGFENRKVKYLSGGERQRVGIARAIAKDTKIILADEPTSALDRANSHRILALLKEVSKDRLVLLVTHDTKKALQYADRVIRLVDGRVVEDRVINEVNGRVAEFKREKAKAKTLRPIFWSQFRRSIIINLFIAIVLSLSVALTNIAIEQDKILKQYEILDVEERFNPYHVLKTHEANNVDFYNIIPRGDEEDEFSYFKEYKQASGGLNPGDVTFLNEYLKDYNIHQNHDRGNIIIEGISVINVFSMEHTDGRIYYWDEPQLSDYTSYIYDENIVYDLVAGRTPNNDNEIMITDTIAKQYLVNKGFVDADLSELLNHKLNIWDIYHSETSQYYKDPNRPFYYTDQKSLDVVGIINTNQLGYFFYDIPSQKYLLNNSFYTQVQDRDQPYLNISYIHPHGYVVTYKELDSYRTKAHFADEYEISDIIYNNKSLSDAIITSFHGIYDYRGINSVPDDLVIDRYNREMIFATSNKELEKNEIIITDRFIRQAFPELSLNQVEAYYLSNFQNKEITLTFAGVHSNITKTFTVVGLARYNNSFPGKSSLFYFSNEDVSEIKNIDSEYNALMMLQLNGVSADKRQEIISDLFEMGYLLSPTNYLPGAYLEYIPNQGQMILKDSEGFEEEVNLSVYHLFSKYYSTDEMNGMNSTLEIINSIYIF
mgnify:CR=1 FL=1